MIKQPDDGFRCVDWFLREKEKRLSFGFRDFFSS